MLIDYAAKNGLTTVCKGFDQIVFDKLLKIKLKH